MVCDKDEKEDIYHFILHCTAYSEERSHSTQLQQPYIESDEDILGHFLFNKEDIEENKELLFSIWKRRQLSSCDLNLSTEQEVTMRMFTCETTQDRPLRSDYVHVMGGGEVRHQLLNYFPQINNVISVSPSLYRVEV